MEEDKVSWDATMKFNGYTFSTHGEGKNEILVKLAHFHFHPKLKYLRV